MLRYLYKYRMILYDLYHILHSQVAVLDEFLHEAHEALNYEAPIVSHRIPFPQEVRYVDYLMDADRQLCAGEISLQFEECSRDCSAGRPARMRCYTLVVRVVVCNRIQQQLECGDHFFERLPRARRAYLVEGVRHCRAQER